MEVQRLREEIILRMHDCSVLAKVYLWQCEMTGKQIKIYTPDAIPFDVSSVLKDYVNLIDQNDGTNLEFDIQLPFMEFDQSLKANLDFKSKSCIKALFTGMGVQEMRAILHCQIMQQQLLETAVQTNDILIDKPVRGL